MAYGEAVKEQCLGTIVEIDEFSVTDEILCVTGLTGRRQVNWAGNSKRAIANSNS